MEKSRRGSLWCLKGVVGTVLTFLAVAPGARADFITPSSIPAAPAAISPGVGDTAVASANLVTTQYSSLGLDFPAHQGGTSSSYTTAIVQLGGVTAWAPVLQVGGGPGGLLAFDGGAFVEGQYNDPATGSPLTTTALTVKVTTAWGAGIAYVAGYDLNGNFLGFKGMPIAANATDEVTLDDPDGIHSFAALVLPASSNPFPGTLGLAGSPDTLVWGVSGVDFGQTAVTPQVAPEPGSLFLAGFGVCGLLGYHTRRRRNGWTTRE